MTVRPNKLPAAFRSDTPDTVLLERFAGDGDGAAFAAITARHGPMVFGVCRRVLRNAADAEDAFQAVFFVLIREAHRLPHRVNLAGWLHTVAVNASLKARLSASRRVVREQAVRRSVVDAVAPPEAATELQEFAAILDEELARLPTAHRDAVLLCDLEGRTQDEAAGILGRPRGTVAVHLSRGRDRLRRRLESRGATAVGVLTTAVAVPDSLLAKCLEQQVTRTASESVLKLSHGIQPGVYSMKTKVMAAVGVVMVVGFGIGIVWNDGQPVGGQRVGAAPVPAGEKTAPAFLFGESIPRKGGQGDAGINVERIDWWVCDPDGKNHRLLNDPKTGRLPVRPVDRTVILKRDADEITLLGPDGVNLTLSLKSGPLAKAAIHGSGQRTTFSFTPDGKTIAFVNAEGEQCRIPVGGKDLALLPGKGINPGDGIHFSPTGKRIAYSRATRPDNFSPTTFEIFVADLDGTNEKRLTRYEDGSRYGFGFLPDGRVAIVGPRSVTAFDPVTGKSEKVVEWPDRISARGIGGINPEGTDFFYDVGGPYELKLYAFDLTAKEPVVAREQYLESFQEMVWVRVPVK